MRSFAVVDWFHITGRGWVATTHSDRSCDRFQFDADLLGTDVLLDGNQYTVRGVEQRRPGTPIGVGEPIGLLIAGQPVIESSDADAPSTSKSYKQMFEAGKTYTVAELELQEKELQE